jgi:hypothetical protein
MAVYFEGVQVDNVATSAGQFTQRTYTVTVADGQLTMRLKDQGGNDPHAVINALTLVRNNSGAMVAMGGVNDLVPLRVTPIEAPKPTSTPPALLEALQAWETSPARISSPRKVLAR